MREESQLDEMRSAIRGDFERLAERRGEQELMRVVEDVPSPVAVDVPSAEPAPIPASLPAPVLVEVDSDPVPQPERDEEMSPQRSWLARFFSP
ncbi:MAG TPA: hypothetical protein VEW90_08915 [Gaiellaceae bacterium]|nr:hypothetical protein [Gaiellaceae bacterium]